MKKNSIIAEIVIGTPDSGKDRTDMHEFLQERKIRNIIIGKPGSGKSINFIKPFIKNYPGKVIWININDQREYLGLQNDVKNIDFNNLEEIKNYNKISIVIPGAYEEISSLELEKNEKQLSSFLQLYEKQKETVIICDNSMYMQQYLQYIFKNTDAISADIVIVLQSIEQLYSCLNLNYYHSGDLIPKEILIPPSKSKWKIISY